MVEKVFFKSASPFELHHILRKMDSAPHHPVFGRLHMPEGDGPFACVIALHGSKGWRPHHDDHVAIWVEAGLAVFQLDCFESRQVDNVVADQMRVTHAMMTADAFNALNWLADHPQIDESRIAITGWSLGATVALYASWEPLAEVLSPSGLRFAAHMPFYPAAHIRPEIQRWSAAPIQILHGTIDNWTPIKFVHDFIEITRPHGANIEVQVYEGVHHSFDSEKPLEWLADAIILDYRTIEIDANGDMSAQIEPGMVLPMNEPEERFAAFMIAQNIGCHVKGDEEARAHAQNFAKEFLLKQLTQ